jgi:hypothetical protein
MRTKLADRDHLLFVYNEFNMLMYFRPRAISKFSYEIRDKDANAAKGISTERRR